MTEGEKIIRINEELTLIQRVNGLTFGTDAYLLAAFAKGGARMNCADLGSGTGVIPLLMAQRDKYKKIFAVEIQKDFASLIERNAKQNSLEDRIIPLSADVRELKATDLCGEIDAVTANPPYMKVDSGKRNEYDEKFIARHEVFGDIGDFCACAKRLLKHGGSFYCVWRPDRLVDLVCALRENNLEPKEMCFVHANTKSAPSMVLVRAKKGASASVVVSEPLFLNLDNDPKALTERAKKIYEECNF